jgi:predicted alpha/beta-fold hydrolase
MSHDSFPETHDLSQAIQMEVTPNGGHVGFVGGSLPWRPIYWLEQRIPAFFREVGL